MNDIATQVRDATEIISWRPFIGDLALNKKIQKGINHQFSEQRSASLNRLAQGTKRKHSRNICSWLINPEFVENVRKWWEEGSFQSSGGNRYVAGLRGLIHHIKQWVHNKRQREIRDEGFLKNKLDWMNTTEEVRPLTHGERMERAESMMEYKSTLFKKELDWKQNSRVKWLKAGHSNSCFC